MRLLTREAKDTTDDGIESILKCTGQLFQHLQPVSVPLDSLVKKPLSFDEFS